MKTGKIDFARLNYILIPKTKEDRDRFRASRAGRVLVPVGRLLWGSLTDEGRTLGIVTLIVGAFALDVQRTTAYVLFCALAGLLTASFVVSTRLRLPGARLSVIAPRRVTVDEVVSFAVTCSAPAESDPLPPVRVRGPFLPWDGVWIDRAPDELVLAKGRAASTTLKARFVARGVHHLDAFVASAIAPVGLAAGAHVDSDPVKLTVVPRIADVTRLPLAIATRHQPGGVALASKSGESMDLLGVRPYRPGDPVRDLHARSWARAGLPVVREYQQEYFTRVGVVLDTDTDDPQVLEAAIELAAGVLANLSRGETLVDVLVVGDRVHELTLGRSLGYLDQALDLLATVERGPALRASDLAGRLSPYLDRLSSVVVVAVKDGAERGAVEESVRARGVACATLVVDADVVRAIRAKEPLAW